MSFGCSVLTRVFLKSCLVPPKREDMKPPYANKLDSRCFGFFCFFFFKKKKKGKKFRKDSLKKTKINYKPKEKNNLTNHIANKN